jgi:glycosyltransferase involved in cell wall biosynthesis
MKQPLVSIIIPCFNVEDHIEAAVSYAQGQSYSNKEIICIDNDSNDETWEKLNELKDGFPELIISQEFRKRAPAARNRGLAMSKGEWIQFLDADDLILPDKIKHQMELIASTKNICFVAAAAMKVDSSSGEKRKVMVMDSVWQGLLQNSLGNTVANLFHKDSLTQVGGWDESLKSSQEYDLMFRLVKLNDQILIDTEARNTQILQGRAGSISETDVEGNKHRFLALNARICAYLKSEKPNEYAALPSAYFEQAYQRIRLNSIKGYADSLAFYKAILPQGFKPQERPYDAWWFKGVEHLAGFPAALKIEAFKHSIKN